MTRFGGSFACKYELPPWLDKCDDMVIFDQDGRLSMPVARGFTLIEVMIALALGTLILAGLSVLFSVNSGNQNELERTIRKLESARYTIDTLGEDAMHAGYYSDFDPNSLLVSPEFVTPGSCATTVAEQGWDTTASPIEMPAPIQGIAAGTEIACLTDRLAGTEAIVVRRAETTAPIPIASTNEKNLYIQISRCQDDPNRIIASAGPADNFTLRLPDCATNNDAVRRLLQRTYYVADCNDCVAKDGIPTLKRVEMFDGALRTSSIAEGVENLQAEYGIDTDNDGQPDSFKTSAGVASTEWADVVAIRLHLLVRDTERTPGYSDSRTYQVGSTTLTPDKYEQGYKRALMTTTVRLSNVAGRRE